jgi:plasmid replication initiation protein
MENNVVVLDNRILFAVCPLQLTEKRLLYILISQIRPDRLVNPELSTVYNTENIDIARVQVSGDTITNDDWYKLTVKEYATLCNLDMSTAKKELVQLLKSLRTKSIKLKEPDGSFIEYNWLSGIAYNAETDTIAVKWNSDIVPFITHLREYFTTFKLDTVLSIPSVYTWKLYEVIKCRKGENRYINAAFSVDELIDLLDVTEGWRQYKHFKLRILKPALLYMQESKLYPKITMIEKRGKGSKKVVGLEFKLN